MSDLDEALKEFLVESYENLEQLDQDLVAAEAGRQDKEMMDRIFRTIHTIKGTCGFLALPKLEKVAHAGENLLSGLRDGRLAWTPEIAGVLLRLTDAIRSILISIDKQGEEGEPELSHLIDELDRMRGVAPSNPMDATSSSPPAAEPIREIPTTEAIAEPPLTVEALPAKKPEKTAPTFQAGESANTEIKAGHVRVEVGLLDKLMNLVGELVLARNQILQHVASGVQDPGLFDASQRLNLITSELQGNVMKARMQPIGDIWGKFPRVVRDLAASCGKRVRLEMEGRQTELDRTIIEAIKDPLTHLIRNAIDHGMETPETRQWLGKPQMGRLRLRAYHENGRVVIEVIDDGSGIDPAKVARKAVERGLITSEQATKMSDHELIRLIFLPGFSTAEKITNVSGRGVGMDVVKTNIEAIGGAIEVWSKTGEGTTLRVRIPLTLAIIPALIVSTGGDRYVIPQVNLVELVRLDSASQSRAIETIRETPVFRLRGSLLPIVYLDSALGLQYREVTEDAPTNIVVLQADGRQFGLIVDGVHDTEEIVVKPLGKQFKGISLYAGAAIMGDGAVALILDVEGISRGVKASSGTTSSQGTSSDGTIRTSDQLHSFLVCKQGEHRRFAVPLQQVARLENIPEESIEHADGREVVQYRGGIMPLLRLADNFGGGRTDQTLRVVVHAEAGKGVGFVVDEIVDIVDDLAQVSRNADGPGLIGTAVIQQRVTDLLDFNGYLRDVDSRLLGVPTATEEGVSS